jgi:hypothetical protein
MYCTYYGSNLDWLGASDTLVGYTFDR